ncbi:MAG: peptidoglycan-binding protein [Acidobacteriota bacterium]
MATPLSGTNAEGLDPQSLQRLVGTGEGVTSDTDAAAGLTSGGTDLVLAGADTFTQAPGDSLFILAQGRQPAGGVDDVANFRGELRPGDQGPGVLELHGELQDFGFRVSNVGPDQYGPSVTQAVRGLQTAYGLPVDGQFKPLDAQTLQQATDPFRGVIPEGQTNGAAFGYPQVRVPVSGYWEPGQRLEISGAFMEPSGHGGKSEKFAIFSDAPNTVERRPPSNMNLGIDYIARHSDNTINYDVHSWFNGTVRQIQTDPVFGGSGAEGYGRRVVVETDFTYPVTGKDGVTRDYPVMVHYGHLASFESGLQVGQRVQSGDVLAQMGGAGSRGDGQYGAHVDLRTWVVTEDYGRVDISPNLLTGRAAWESKANDPAGYQLAVEEYAEQASPPHIGPDGAWAEGQLDQVISPNVP